MSQILLDLDGIYIYIYIRRISGVMSIAHVQGLLEAGNGCVCDMEFPRMFQQQDSTTHDSNCCTPPTSIQSTWFKTASVATLESSHLTISNNGWAHETSPTMRTFRVNIRGKMDMFPPLQYSVSAMSHTCTEFLAKGCGPLVCLPTILPSNKSFGRHN